MTSLLSILREATPDCHNKAVQGLKDGSLTMTLTRQTDAEIRALVKNGDGIEYGVTLTGHGAFCSCKDALYRGRACKHALAVCLSRLQRHDPVADRIHLMWPDGHILCGVTGVKRFWLNWTLNALNWSDIVCQACVQTWTRPAVAAEGR
jgi:hypothetical protein